MFHLQLSSLLPGLRQNTGKPRSRQRMVLRNLQMLPLVNCPNGTALSLGTNDSKLSLFRPRRSYATHSNRQSLFNNEPLVRYDSSKFPLAGQEFPDHGKGAVPPVPWPFTPETRVLAKSYHLQGSVPSPLGTSKSKTKKPITFLVPNRNAIKMAASSRSHPWLAL